MTRYRHAILTVVVLALGAASGFAAQGAARECGVMRSTDVSWSHGDGPEVSGPIMSLVMAMTGRREAIADLAGEGVAILSSRP